MTPLRFILVIAALVVPACGTTELRGEESVTFQRRPGPTCYVRVLVDADKWVTVEAPFACVPPPEFCAPGPGESP